MSSKVEQDNLAGRDYLFDTTPSNAVCKPSYQNCHECSSISLSLGTGGVWRPEKRKCAACCRHVR